jgi:hypothetical protein
MNVIEMLNTIRDNASATYQERIPEATRTNMEAIRYAMLGEDDVAVQVANEFMSTLLNKLVRSVVITKRFENPLKSLKKGNKPTGDTIEEIYTNFIKGSAYNGDSGAAMLERELPDVKTVYHRMNKQHKYKVTVNEHELSRAFASYEALESFIQEKINTLYNSSELDEFLDMKQLLKSAKEKNAMKIVTIADPLLSAENGQEFIKSVKTASGLMSFPNSDWNAYLTAQKKDKKPIITFSRKSEQVLILDTATDIGVSVDVLAHTFNMTVAEFNDTRKIVIDVFPDPTMRAVLVDEKFFQIWDDKFLFKSFENPESLYNNYWLHVWQTLAYSILVNAVAFCVEPAAAG